MGDFDGKTCEFNWIPIDSDIDEMERKYRDYYHKDLCLTYECRLKPVSSLLDFSMKLPPSPIGMDGICMASLNHPHRLVDLIREHESGEAYVSEALITSYPMDKAISRYRRFCRDNLDDRLANLKVRDAYIGKRASNVDDKVVDVVMTDKENPQLMTFMFPMYDDDDYEKFISDLSNDMNRMGWNLSYDSEVSSARVVQLFKNRKIRLYTAMFEEMFFDPSPELSDVLYHVSPGRYFNKICERGLVPKAKSDKFKYPERVYLFNNAILKDIEKYAVKKVNLLRNIHSNPHVSDNDFYLFAVKREKLENHPLYKSKKMVFYYDPCYDGAKVAGIGNSKGIFTYGNIPRELIEDICWHYEISDEDDGTVKLNRSTASMKKKGN